jgi:hypothetical protein
MHAQPAITVKKERFLPQMNDQMHNNRKYFKLASLAALAVAISHLIGHMLPVKIENLTEAKLLTLMVTYQKHILGGVMSMMEIQNGLSLCYSLFFFTIAFINLQLLKRLNDVAVLKELSIIYALTMAVGAMISLRYFFWLPVISFLTLFVLFSLSVIKFQKN